MNTFRRIPESDAQDPVALSVERLLQKLQADKYGKLQRQAKGRRVRLSFARADVEADTYDIALLRLAGALLNDDKYRRVIVNALHDPMRASINQIPRS